MHSPPHLTLVPSLVNMYGTNTSPTPVAPLHCKILTVNDILFTPETWSRTSPLNLKSTDYNYNLNHARLTKISTWNIDHQVSYDGLVHAYIQGNIDQLNCIEPATFMFMTSARTSITLISTADRAGYAIYMPQYRHTYIRLKK